MSGSADKDLPRHLSATLECKQGAVRAVRYNVDGAYCLTCGSDKTLKLWNPIRKILLKTYSGHGYEVLDACSSCDNSQLASCGMDKTVIVWDVSTGQATRKYRGHAGTVNCVSFNEDSAVVVSGSLDTTVKCWDVRSKRQEPVQTLEECKDNVTSLDVSDHEILVGCADAKVRRYDLRNGQLLTDEIGSPVTCVSFTKDGQCLLVSSNNDTVKLMDKSTGELLQEFSGHANKTYRIDSVLNNKDQLVLSGSENGLVYAWDLVEGSVVGRLDHANVASAENGSGSGSGGSSLTVHSLTFHPTECQLMTAARGTVYLWKKDKDEDEEECMEEGGDNV